MLGFYMLLPLYLTRKQRAESSEEFMKVCQAMTKPYTTASTTGALFPIS